MPIYHKLGEMPRKKHTTFYKPDGKSLYREELISSLGFSGIYSNRYHINMPTKAFSVKEIEPEKNVDWPDAPLMHFHFKTDALNNGGDFLSARECFLQNSNVKIYTAKPDKNADFFYKNAHGHEYIFVHHGSGIFHSDYGKLPFVAGDQIIVPQSTIYQMEFDKPEGNKLLVVESDTAFEIPGHYKNEYGQFEEHAPYEERDFKLPSELHALDEKGKFRLIIKSNYRNFEYILPYHPFDVVGWDGYLYPFAFNIRDYNPKVGRIHLPPPIHLLYKTQSFVLCNFNPRPFDWHPQAVPAPYFHANIDSAEMLYYVEGDFMSRKGVGEGSITLHPNGIPHGPQPGKTEASIGAKFTEEYAIMLDTFGSLYPTLNVKETMDPEYYRSWIEEGD